MRKVFTLLTLIASLLVTIQAAAQDNRSLVWERWDVVIDDIDTTNNTFDVTEIYDIDFNGTFRFGSAVIPDDNLDSISNIRVSQDGERLRSSCSGQPGTFCVESVREGTSIVYNFLEPIRSGNASFEISYTVEGALRSYEGGDQLWWIAIPSDHFGFPIERSTITVELPDGFAPREGVDPVETYGAPGEIRVNGTRVVATATRNIGGNEAFEIRVQYPHNPAMRVPSWQARFDEQRAFEETTAPLINIGMILVGLVFSIGGPLWTYYMWYARGRDPKIGPVPEYLSEPPSDLPPALVGTLIDEKVDIRDILSTLLDLARREYVVIEEERKEGFFGLGGGSDFTFKLTDKDVSELRPYEQQFVRKFFGVNQMERTLDSLKNKFYAHIPALQNALYDEITKDGYFRANPNTTRNGWALLGTAAFIGSIILGVLLLSANTLETSTPMLSLLCIPAGLLITSLALFIVSNKMPAKTRTGAEEAAKWGAFLEFLSRMEKYQSMEEAAQNFERYLPYAVAFGLEKQWIRKFDRVQEHIPMPTWYYPRHLGGRYGRGYTAGTPLSRGGGLPSAGDVLPGELASAGGGGLSDVASGLSGGLDELSRGITSMLNSAGSTLTSRPQQTSSSGSWSSGGRSWSGGGSFGGGGSGGGSRGFG